MKLGRFAKALVYAEEGTVRFTLAMKVERGNNEVQSLMNRIREKSPDKLLARVDPIV
jgi:hypothetical protein